MRVNRERHVGDLLAMHGAEDLDWGLAAPYDAASSCYYGFEHEVIEIVRTVMGTLEVAQEQLASIRLTCAFDDLLEGFLDDLD